ncbi:MAG: valine dehydrogenase [Actinobacteria bacterium]|nr:valine dehydrogenase [Actinomycetota bacterium]
MQVFDRVNEDAYEQVVFCHDRGTGLRAIIAIHSTRLGPSLGGTRFFPYTSEDEALEDVLRLAKGMTYKAAAAGLDLGGGKAVILGDPQRQKTEALLRAYARFVDSLGGRYITAEDVGTTQPDMDIIKRETRHVTGVSPSLGGSGDPSAATAYGVLHAMKAVAVHLWGSSDLGGRHVVVSGVGKVGQALVRHLVEERADITVSDISESAVQRAAGDFAAAVVAPEKAHAVACDIYSPCAMGRALNPRTIPELRCAAVVGAANNQLDDPSCPELLDQAEVLYAPDYVVNAGGIINIAEELKGYNRQRAYGRIRGIFATTTLVLQAAAAEGIPTVVAADRLAERRIEQLSAVQLIRTPLGPT